MSKIDFHKFKATTYNELLNPENAVRVGEKLILPRQIVTQDKIDAALKLLLNDGDIFVTSYPKSGTTWLQAVVWWIINVQKTYAKGATIESLSPPSMDELKATDQRFIDLHGVENMEGLPTPRVLVSHLPWDFVPKVSKQSDTVKYVHIIRDPKDSAVSFFRFFEMMFKLPEEDWNCFIDHFIRGTGIYGDFFDCVKSWWQRKDDDNVHVMFYEEMLADPGKEILKLAQFLSDDKVSYDEVLKSDPKVLERVVNEISFKSMKDVHLKSKEGSGPLSNFYRKGIRGDWKNHFNESQVSLMNERIKKELGEPFVQMYVD